MSAPSPEFDVLRQLAGQIGDVVSTTSGTADQDSTFSPGLPGPRARMDRPVAAELGVSALAVGGSLRSAVVGDVATRYRDGDDDVRARLQEADRGDRAALEALLCPPRPARLRRQRCS